jgi:hypothetical protein
MEQNSKNVKFFRVQENIIQLCNLLHHHDETEKGRR